MPNKYILTSRGSFACVEDHSDYVSHAIGLGQPRKDHKYIKREQKNGKWVYTYPDDAKGSSKSLSKPTLTPKVSTYEKPVASSKVTKPTLTPKVSTYEKPVTSSVKVKQADDANPNQLDSRSILEKKATPKTKSDWESVVNKAKDFLGFDEKEKYETAKSEHNVSQLQVAAARGNLNDGKAKYKKVNGEWVAADGATADFERYLSKYSTTAEKYVKSQEEYFNTPIGRLEQAGNSISDAATKAANWLTDLFSKPNDSKKKTKKKNRTSIGTSSSLTGVG